MKLLVLAFLLFSTANSEILSEECQLKPMDIVFVLDSSSSIWLPHWEQMIAFVKNLVLPFNLSPDKARVGLITFADRIKIWWQLHDFTSRKDLLNAFKKIKKQEGNTNTAKALRFIRRKMFTQQFGARNSSDVAQIAILLTDGKSDYRKETKKEALLLKRLTRIKVIAIGIGKADKKELRFIASKSKTGKQKKRNFYYLKDFSQLNYKLKLELSTRACELQRDGSGQNQPLSQCQKAKPADVLFVSDPFAVSPQVHKQSTDLFKAILDKLPLSTFGYRAGVIPESPCMSEAKEAPISKFYDNKIDLNETAIRINENRENLANYLAYVREELLTYSGPARRKSVILMIDGHQNYGPIIEETKQLSMMGVDVIAVGIDKSVRMSDIRRVASRSALAFKSTQLDLISALEGDLIRSVCPL